MTAERIVSAGCPVCGARSSARVLAQDERGTDMAELDAGCEHRRELEIALFDAAQGRDPAARCEDCGRNPCASGGPPGTCTEGQRARADQIDSYHELAAEKGESLTDEFAARIAASGDVEDLLGEIQAAVDDDDVELSAAQIDALRDGLRETFHRWQAELAAADGAGGEGHDAH